jgi:hypothetical protein
MTPARKVIGQDPDGGLKLVNILRLQPRSALARRYSSASSRLKDRISTTEAFQWRTLLAKCHSRLTGLSVGPVDLANEKHYSVIEISELWALSQKTVRRIFEKEPGVIRWGSEETRHKRAYPDFTCT